MLFCYLHLQSFLFWQHGGKEEGTLNENNILLNILSDIFIVFRFPVLTFLGNYINGVFFFVSLTINCLLYALLIEFLLHLLRKNIGNKQEQRVD